MNNGLLLGNLSNVIFLVALHFLSATLLQKLPQEVNCTMHVDGADERHQPEVELLRRKREQEGAVLEDLLHGWRDSSLNKVVGILDASLQVRVQLVVVEGRRLHSREASPELDVLEHRVFLK